MEDDEWITFEELMRDYAKEHGNDIDDEDDD